MNSVNGIYSIGPYEDTEWEETQKANEKYMYFLVHMTNGGTCIKQYKPSVAKLVSKRTGQFMVLITKGTDINER